MALRDPAMLRAPFCYLAGHRLVEFSRQEAENFRRYVENGGFVFVDDCNHDIDGLFARSFEAQMASIAWSGRQCISGVEIFHHYYRLTSDNRITIGGGVPGFFLR